MPIYVRKCNDCAHQFEEFAKMSDSMELIRCPNCNGYTSGVPCAPRTERRFAGTEQISRRYEFLPFDIERMRKHTADTGAKIDDHGKVHFPSRSVERKFHQAMDRLSDPAPGAEASD